MSQQDASSLPDLERQLGEEFLSVDVPEPLDPNRVAVRPLLNYGGFINRSFQVTDGRRAYHVKLSSDAHSLRGLGRWRALNDRLTESFHAPTMCGWIDLPEASFSGPVFDWIEGSPPTGVTGELRDDTVTTIRRLHSDRALAAQLEQLGDVSTSCAAAYRSTYHQRFVEDLKLVVENPPPFVTSSLVEWLIAEVESMVGLVVASAAFAGTAGTASHRDLWLDNLRVTPDGRLYILDWDETGLGDPMMDWAMLFGPSRSRPRPAVDTDVTGIPFSAEERERFRTYARASLLDWIIDPLADWVDAAHEPLHGAAVRESNRRVFEEALSAYRELYR